MPPAQVERAMTTSPDSVGPALAALKEDQWFERKSARIQARDLADWLVGFANADGGTIVVGLQGGKTEATDRWPDRRNDQMQASLDFCDPPVRIRHRLVDCINDLGQPDHLLAIEVRPGDVVHTNKKDQVFLRVGDENRHLSFQQRQELVYDKGQANYGASDVSVGAVSG